MVQRKNGGTFHLHHGDAHGTFDRSRYRHHLRLFSYTDVAALAATQYQDDRSVAVQALLRSGPNVKYEPNRAYADAKIVFAWWAAALARRLHSGMSHAPETAARRYLQASEFGTDVSGQFLASAPKKITGPIEALRQPHFHDHANQEAAWQAVVGVSGVDFSCSAS